ncbi:MAG: cupin [SAR202 cluster bacterium]|jgi:quercetin dioxygenase-like cupin family protein|nr:cupin [Chloroflexota bacterium]MDP6798512.1 cupin domain-containing protein [SAR202 cluster bacterium]MQG58354.1 cupin [SAR202 cluster bacterium]MQG69461.1 cupin [SAR202 cluster bacterium]HAL46855.1 cupin [Dehalococcoidia bacterium]|tara:strand:+ start:1231 stop:1509 length:279 start_codon:yes stop_codon:yes gene_type:complete
MSQAIHTVLIDNERVAVHEWRFPPGAETGWHVHSLDYVVVPLTTGRLRIVSSDGKSISELVAGAPYYRAAGAEHNVINANDYEFTFIETEIK